MMTFDLIRRFSLPLALCLGSVAQAENYALVVGIDAYETYDDLRGAVNDARLLASSLADFGVRDLTLLLDEDATYEAISSQFQSYLNRAKEGDTIIFTYAGHGHYVEDEDGDEYSDADPHDQYDETLVLGGAGPGREDQVIVDDELGSWFMEAYLAGVNVVFLSDSCHSGTVMRGGTVRMIDEFAATLAPPKRPMRDLPVEEDELENLVFLAGASEAEPVQEVSIDGRIHGALSYSFARGLRGLMADGNGDGQISRNELRAFIPRVARSLNEGRPLPDMIARAGADFAVLVPDRGGISADAFKGTDDDGLKQLDFDEVRLQSRNDLKWNRKSGMIINDSGEVVATDIQENRLKDVDDKFAVVKQVQETVIREGMDVRVLVDGVEGRGPLPLGQGFRIEIGPVPYPYLTVFNLANTGEVQVIYPYSAAERAPLRTGTRIGFNASASEPVGIDHIVAIASREDPVKLRQQLGWSMAVGTFIPVLDRLTLRDGVAAGLASIATTRR